LTVRCGENSLAWQYCEKNNIKHEQPIASEHSKHKELVPKATEEVSAAHAKVHAVPEAPQEKAPAPAPRKKDSARWLVPALIFFAIAAAAGLQIFGMVDILGLLGL